MDLDIIKKYYQEKIENFGFTAKGMDWKNTESQYLRFEMIAKYIDFEDSPSILDVGCGNGEFLNYCLGEKLTCNYQGLDITDAMVDAVNAKYGSNTALLGDIDAIDSDLSFDYVIASGTFNAKLQADDEVWRQFFYENIQKMFEKSKKGIVFNCMTQHVDWEYDRLYYPDLSDLTSFIVENLSRKFIINHSYNLYEITISITR